MKNVMISGVLLSALVSTGWLSGAIPFSLLLDGVDDYVEIADDSGLKPAANSWTTSFWMRSDTASQSAFIITKRGGVTPYPQ